ncbi:MAG TPA: prepilin peptidase [Terracidiphilus sp.]|jgi:leader peptidase (prepilin peptidase)/N-methyltransferase
MLRIPATIFAGLLGLAFGSFLNVCVSRWPRGESVVHPRSHCRACGRSLAWWENVPLLSWIALRGRCRSCGSRIGVRYALVEATVGLLWSTLVWYSNEDVFAADVPARLRALNIAATACGLGLFWLLVALAALDAENLWLPDFLTYPGIAVGILLKPVFEQFGYHSDTAPRPLHALLSSAGSAAAAGAIILFIRWIYRAVRGREGLGLGDAKLMALLGAWLGLQLAVLSLFLGVVLGAAAAVFVLATRSRRTDSPSALVKLPLGTFLCIGGMVSALWGKQILSAYLHWAGL